MGTCSVVVRFDRAFTTTGLIQSRGRARARGGRCVLFSSSVATAEAEAANHKRREATLLEAVDIVAGPAETRPPPKRAAAPEAPPRAAPTGDADVLRAALRAGASGRGPQGNYRAQLNLVAQSQPARAFDVKKCESGTTPAAPFGFCVEIDGTRIGAPGYAASKAKAKDAAAESALRAMLRDASP